MIPGTVNAAAGDSIRSTISCRKFRIARKLFTVGTEGNAFAL
jgi:hypothetical protein